MADISAKLINEDPLLVLPSLACEIGLSHAIVLQQIYFRTYKKEPDEDGFRWCWDTYATWREEVFPFWTERTIGELFRSLADMGRIVSKKAPGRSNWDKTRAYSINFLFEREEEISSPMRKKVPQGEEKTSFREGKNFLIEKEKTSFSSYALDSSPRLPLDSMPENTALDSSQKAVPSAMDHLHAITGRK